MLVTNIFSFLPTFFSILSKKNFTIQATVALLSANAFNLNLFKILSFDEEITEY